MMSIHTLIDLGKLKMLYSGLGQFSYYFGKHISNRQFNSFFWNFLTPNEFADAFGIDWNYEITSMKRRYFPGLCKKYDLWHATHQDSFYFPSDKVTPYILTIHDLNFLEEKSDLKARRRLKSLQKKVDRASYITFVSKYTAKVTNDNLDLKNTPQKVIYNGVDIDTEKDVNKPSFLSDGKFLFTIGMVLAKKNFHILVDFIEQLADYKLVIAGKKKSAYAFQLLKKIQQKKLSHKIILPGEITQDDKIYLFRNCEAFLFPSRIEGFGIPIIEAMRFGKPVFCSQLSSLPEIGGECAYYWDSFEPTKMIDTFARNMKIYQAKNAELSLKNRNYSHRFNWNKAILEYLEVYNEVVQEQSKHKKIGSSVSDQLVHDSEKKVKQVSKPIRVLHLSSEKSWKGGEQQIAYLFEELNKLGIQNYIACRKNSAFEQYCQNKNWLYYPLSFKSPIDILTAFSINKICIENKIDILHIHTSVGHAAGVLSRFFGHKTHLILARRVDNPVKDNMISKWKYNHPSIKKIITVSNAIKKILSKKLKDKSKCITIYDGVDVNKFKHEDGINYFRENYSIGKDQIIIGNTSALADHKDYFTFINTAEYLIRKGLNAKFFIIGEGPERKNIENYISVKNLNKHVVLTGFLHIIKDILPSLDVFLFTSKTEGLGSSILDAFACGVPVVATKAGGIPEMVNHGYNGLLSDVKDYKNLAENILMLLDDYTLRKKIIQNARKTVNEKFSKEITAEKTMDVYVDILLCQTPV